MSPELQQLEAQVTATLGIEQSAVTLIRGLADQLVAAKQDPAKIQELSDHLKASADTLAAAIAAQPTP